MSFAPVATAPVDLESQTQVTTKQEQKSWLGRTVRKLVPSRNSDDNKQGGIGCCSLGLCLIIAGGIMWGVCKDPESSGCNQAVLTAGKALTGVGCGLVGLSCIVIVCLLGCAIAADKK